ncbi:hypothetical protein [Roseomonas indoligenes]|uniref:Uncharacterized protein n=1 Tax=Roseomonas indoligenes TaxID=2820811 RepID=A0A940MRT7_9PROT|nr:hypothetical protein [Pararoseomonas indoligenes]MBP0492858.1 hypothetical protein [Pararoseomonas indoligenes]
MAFLERVKQILADAAPEKYPVLIDKTLYAVVAIYDDYADLRRGDIYHRDGHENTVAVVNYIRAVPFSEIKSVQAIPDWHIIRLPDDFGQHDNLHAAALRLGAPGGNTDSRREAGSKSEAEDLHK